MNAREREATARRLGWPRLLEALSDFSRTPLGRRRVALLAPLPDRASVLRRLTEIEAVRQLRAGGFDLPLGDLPEVEDPLDRVRKAGVLEGKALRDLAAVLRAAADCATYLVRHAEVLGSVSERLRGLGGQERLAREIERSIAPSGEVEDEASEALAEARARVRRLHEGQRRRAEALLRDPAWQERLQEAWFSVRNDRYVLPVKAQFRYQVGGIVHNVSNTGQTVFVEPSELVEAGNELALAEAEAKEEARRILVSLTEAVARVLPEIEADLERLEELDFLAAAAALAERLDATAPEIPEASDAVFDLKALRHPLLVLDGKTVVASDVRLEAGARGLVVSGPNAGGKTVTVTAVALAAELLRHGLPVPAGEGSRLPLYTGIDVVLGDEQDLHRDLSTFSAHLVALGALLERAGPGRLLVVDEICADTDPREGSALAAAVVEALLEAGAQVLVTTHFEALKVLAATDPRLLGAAVGFDEQTLAPTYRLTLHASAGSSALEVARRVGLPAAVVERARAHLSGAQGSLGEKLARLEALQRETARAREALEAERRAVAEARAELEAAREAVERERQALRAEARRELLEEIEAARRRVVELLRELERAPSVRRAGETERALQAMAEREKVAAAREVQETASEKAAGGVADSTAAALAPGTWVRAPTLGDRRGQVLEVGAGDVLVAFGALKMRVAPDLLLPATEAPKATHGGGGAPERRGRSRQGQDTSAPLEGCTEETVDLRGLRVEEALSHLETALDHLLRAGASRAVVIHGHGTGALKKAVRAHLGTLPYVQSHRPGEDHEGGDGVTIVTF